MLHEVKEHVDGYLLWKIPRSEWTFGDDILKASIYGAAAKNHVVVFAHRLNACLKLGRALKDKARVEFRDGNKKNVAFENLRILEYVEV